MRSRGRTRSQLTVLTGLALAAAGFGVLVSALTAEGGYATLGLASLAVVALVLAVSVFPAALAKVRGALTRTRWWHWLWFCVFASGLTFRGRSNEAIQETPVDFWAGYRIGLVGLVAMVLLYRLARRTTSWELGLTRGLPAGVFVLGLVSLASTVWSVYPMWTLYKAVEYLIDVALLAAIVMSLRQADEIKSLFDWTWLLTGLLVLTVWLGVFFRPDEAVLHGIGTLGVQILGVLPSVSTNGVGDLAGTLLIVATSRLLFGVQGRSLYGLIGALAAVTLILAQSRSPFTGALLGLLTVLLLARRMGLLVLTSLAGVLLLVLTNAGSVAQEAFLRGQDPQQFQSLSGRVGWWELAWGVMRENPLLGLGGWAAGRFAVLGQLGDTDTSSLHNGWLEILVGVGLAGFVPFLITFLGTWRTLLRPPLAARGAPAAVRPSTALRIEAIGVFVMLCFRSLFTAEFVWHPPVVFFLVLGYAELLRRDRAHHLRLARVAPVAWRSAAVGGSGGGFARGMCTPVTPSPVPDPGTGEGRPRVSG
jgi:exopolysaccharide production protein ExoQ